MLFLGKMTFFVANQAKIETLPSERISVLEAEYKAEDEENKAIAAQTKALSNGKLHFVLVTFFSASLRVNTAELAKIRGTPTNDELGSQIDELKTTVSALS